MTAATFVLFATLAQTAPPLQAQSPAKSQAQGDK
jgi:hypothetical protein